MTTDPRLADLASRMGARITGDSALSGGCVGDVRRVDLDTGQRLVVKRGAPGSGLDIEGEMLRYLRAHTSLRVPDVLLGEPDLLVMEHLEPAQGGERFEEACADALASLHEISAPGEHAGMCGFEFDTLIGALHQPNPWTGSWLAFFREQRLLAMAREAHRAGRLDDRLLRRVESLAGRLDRWIDEPSAPSLIHGDVWSGNVLCTRGPDGAGVPAFIDPAISFSHAEIELAFISLFGTFGGRFFDRYAERRPIADGFFEERCALYNLYPLLVHVRLFGGGYVGQVARTLDRFGA